MQTSVTFKNLDSSKHFKSYVQDKLDKFDKLIDKPVEASVVLSVEKLRHIAEIKLKGGRLNINAKVENNDMHAAIDLVLDKLKKQIKKNRQKKRGRKGGTRGKISESEIMSEDAYFVADESEKLVKIKNIEYKPMDIEEAAMQLELLPNHFLVFTNARTEKVNVLYRRKDGHFGLIQPEGN